MSSQEYHTDSHLRPLAMHSPTKEAHAPRFSSFEKLTQPELLSIQLAASSKRKKALVSAFRPKLRGIAFFSLSVLSLSLSCTDFCSHSLAWPRTPTWASVTCAGQQAARRRDLVNSKTHTVHARRPRPRDSCNTALQHSFTVKRKSTKTIW